MNFDVTYLMMEQTRHLIVRICLGLGTHLFVKVLRPEDSEEAYSVFESSCHLLLPV